eukprot:scaffold35658_cov24-Tisochrysis_lutea.AAC.1
MKRLRLTWQSKENWKSRGSTAEQRQLEAWHFALHASPAGLPATETALHLHDVALLYTPHAPAKQLLLLMRLKEICMPATTALQLVLALPIV